jgi:Na+-translocating ferredoxin:NAD+ oxidoreductase RnfC subunit
MDLQQLKKCIQDSGCVGAGGAGFPAAFKLAEGADSLIINAAECEPLLYTDFALLQRHLAEVCDGAEQVVASTGIRQAYLGIESHTASLLHLSDKQKLSPHVQVAVLPDVYPMGDEIILIYQVLRRVVQPGCLPITQGVIVLNAETLYNISRAVQYGEAVTQKWVTLNGKVREPMVVKIPVGTPVKELFEAFGITVPDGYVVLDGGPAMGAIIDPETAVVKKTTKGLLVLPRDIPAVISKLAENRTVNVRATSNCCQCTMCTDMCPRALIGYPLEPHKIVRTPLSAVEMEPEKFTAAAVCSNCGVCELTACSQGISPRRVYTQVKGILAKNHLRYMGHKEAIPHPDRDGRLLPRSRFIQRLGVGPFDGHPVYQDARFSPKTITLPLHQHVGAPAVACVKVGDRVTVGQLIAQAAEGISANIHSSVNGTVTAVSAGSIQIRCD